MPKIRDMARFKRVKAEGKNEGSESKDKSGVYMKNDYGRSKTLRSMGKSRKIDMDEGME